MMMSRVAGAADNLLVLCASAADGRVRMYFRFMTLTFCPALSHNRDEGLIVESNDTTPTRIDGDDASDCMQSAIDYARGSL